MATGHINPGFKESISSIYQNINSIEVNPQKSLTAELSNKRWLLSQPNISEDILDKIRRDARHQFLELSSNDSQFRTSYTGNYQFKRLDAPVIVRATSPTRKNNPHPPMIFLRCRLRQLPGFHSTPVSRPQTTSTCLSVNDPALQIKSLHSSVSAPSLPNSHNYAESTTSADKDRPSTSTGKSSSTSTIERRPKTTASILSRSTITSSNQSSHPYYQDKSHNLPINHSPVMIQRPYTGTQCSRLTASSSSSVANHYRTNLSLLPQRPNTSQLIYQNNNPQYPRGDYSIHYQWPVSLRHHSQL